MNSTKSTVSVKVIRQIAQSNFGTGPYDSNTSQDHVARPLCLDPKDIFYPRPNLRSRFVSLLLPFRQLAVTGAFPLKMFPVSVFFQPANCILRTIGRVGPYITAGITGIKQFIKNIAVMYIGACHLVSPNKLILHVYRDVIFITKEIFTILSSPAGISIFLSLLVLTPPVRLLTVFDLLIFITAVALYRNLDNTCIYDLSFLCPLTLLMKKIIKPLKQGVNHARLDQIFTKPPDGCCIGNLTGSVES